MLPATLTDPAARAAERLIARGETIAVTESSAGGLISAALLSVPGASAYYKGGIIVYTLDGARNTIGGAAELPPGTRSASEPFASYLARAAQAKVGADWGVGETGATGPSGNPYGDPAGHAWIAVAGPDGTGVGGTITEHVLTGDDDRAANMEEFAARALRLLVAALG